VLEVGGREEGASTSAGTSSDSDARGGGDTTMIGKEGTWGWVGRHLLLLVRVHLSSPDHRGLSMTSHASTTLSVLSPFL
jgi:hypothetical protein